MTVTVSKLNYGVVIGPDHITISKINNGVVMGFPDHLAVTKMNYGVVVDTTTPGPTSGRRRQIIVS
jgi:hypothetical protein